MEEEKFDLKKAKVKVDDKKMIDENGNPRNDVLIFENNILLCHSQMKEKVEQAIELFFKTKGAK